PQRQADAADVHQRDRDGDDQAAVEHSARSQQREQLARIGAERIEVGDQQQQLGADQRADDDVDAEVEHPVRVEAAVVRADDSQLQPQQVGGSKQDTVGVQSNLADDRDRSQLQQLRVHRSKKFFFV